MEIKRILHKVFFSALFLNACYADISDLRDFRYSVEFNLEHKAGLLQMLKNLLSESEIDSMTNDLRIVALQNKPINHMRALKDRIKNDIEEINRRAHALGFFNSHVDYKINQKKDRSVHIIIDIKPGRMFDLQLDVSYANYQNVVLYKHQHRMTKKCRGMKASIKNITELIQLALKDLQTDGFFSPRVVTQRVHLDYDNQIANLELVIDPGKRALFGYTKIDTFEGIDKTFIQNRLEWQSGDVFDIRKLEETKDNLSDTQIFSKIKIKPNAEHFIDKKNNGFDGKVPIDLTLEAEKKHMIDIGILYSGMRNMNFHKNSRIQKSLKSIIARLSWTRFNAFEGGEKLQVTVEGTPMRAQSKRADYDFEVHLSVPDVIWKNVVADYEVSRRQELTNAFFRKMDKCAIDFSWSITSNVSAHAGAIAESTYVDSEDIFFQKGCDRKYQNISFPVLLVLDRTDDILNPTKGYRLCAKFSPMFLRKTSLKNINYGEISGAYNYPIDALHKNILAINCVYKKLFTRTLDHIPVDQRIYCGGMNSVRGFAYQMATEIGANIECPVGGKSAFEFNSEFRRKFLSNVGGIIFLDGAKNFENKSRFIGTERRRWFLAYGIGVRYFTEIGPIRFDVAFPIKRRSGIDSKVQFIMSLGQAF